MDQEPCSPRALEDPQEKRKLLLAWRVLSSALPREALGPLGGFMTAAFREARGLKGPELRDRVLRRLEEFAATSAAGWG